MATVVRLTARFGARRIGGKRRYDVFARVETRTGERLCVRLHRSCEDLVEVGELIRFKTPWCRGAAIKTDIVEKRRDRPAAAD